MLKIVINDLDLNDFIDFVYYELQYKNIDEKALELLYWYLVEIYPEGVSNTLLSNIIRFDFNIMDFEEFKNNYEYDGITFNCNDDIEDYITHYTSLYGSYEVDGVLYYVFGEL